MAETKGTILVVDDEPEILDLFRQVLTSKEFNPVDHSTPNVSVGQDPRGLDILYILVKVSSSRGT